MANLQSDWFKTASSNDDLNILYSEVYQSDSRIVICLDHTVLCMRDRSQNTQNFDYVTFNQSNIRYILATIPKVE